MTAPHECPIPGPAADFALALRAHLPMLETARLRLRAPTLGDFEPWAEIFTTPASVYMDGPCSREQAFVDFAASVSIWLLRGHGPLAIVEKASGTTLGFVQIGFEPGDEEPELGWFVVPRAEGQGFVQEAASALREYAFGALGMARLVSYIDPRNVRSRRLAQRLGAVLEGSVDGSEAWVHRPVAQTGSHTHGHTVSISKPDAFQTSKRGD